MTMPRTPRERPKTLEFTPTRRRKPLIDWNDPSKQAHVLDWRHRAQEFGLAVETQDEDEQLQPGAPVGREEVDLVRVYLQHIGKRKLLKAAEERVIGERIENAQRDLVMALGDIPSAVQTLSALAERIRTKGDPAAELILLPEGGELKEDNTTPVLKSFARIKRRRCIIDGLREKLANPKLGVRSRADIE